MKYFFLIFLILAMFACKNQQSPSDTDLQKPDSLISRSQMVRILTDVHLTEAALSYLKNKGGSPKSLSNDYYNAVFSKYKISRKNFDANFNYYKSDQENLIKMYEEVIKNLEILKKQGETQQE